MSLALFISPAMQMDTSDARKIEAVRAPQFAPQARELVQLMSALDYESLKATWGASDAIAQAAFATLPQLTASLDQLCTNPSSRVLPQFGAAAISAFKGIQYTYMAPTVMTSDQLSWLDGHLFIGSGLFGVVRALDWVCPYRLEMKTKLAGTPQKSLYRFWGGRLAQAIASQLSAREAPTLVFVSSQEYTRAVAPHAAALGLNTCELTFLSPSKAGKLGQRAPECKIARGTFVRWCAENTPDTPDDLRKFSDRGYQFDPERSQFPHALTFVKTTQDA